MLDKPKTHKRRNPLPLTLMIGLAALCFIVAARGMGGVASVIMQP